MKDKILSRCKAAVAAVEAAGNAWTRSPMGSSERSEAFQVYQGALKTSHEAHDAAFLAGVHV